MDTELISGFKSVRWTLGSGSMTLSMLSFACWTTLSFSTIPQWLGIQQKWTHVANERIHSLFVLHHLQAGRWVRVDYYVQYIMPYWIHVLIIDQCQSDGCSLSSKDGVVVWELYMWTDGSLYRSIATGSSLYGKWEDSQSLCPQSPVSKTLSQRRLLIIPYWIHVSIKGQWQSDGNSLSSKDGLVVQFFGQVMASCLTILKMAVDDHHCSHSVIHLGSVSVDFIMWSLNYICVEFSLGSCSGDHNLLTTSMRVVLFGSC